MINRKLLEAAYRKAYGYADDIKLDISEGLVRLIEEYEFLVTVDIINSRPLRWYPSGRKVFTFGFRIRIFLKMTIHRAKHLLWRIKNRV